MDFALIPLREQQRLKGVLTPIFTPEMGERLRLVRMKQLRTQAELASVLSTKDQPISKQTLAKIEAGRLKHLPVSLARLEAVLGEHIAFVLIARGAALYDRSKIGLTYHDVRFRALRKRNGLDPKLGQTPPWTEDAWERRAREQRLGITFKTPWNRKKVR